MLVPDFTFPFIREGVDVSESLYLRSIFFLFFFFACFILLSFSFFGSRFKGFPLRGKIAGAVWVLVLKRVEIEIRDLAQYYDSGMASHKERYTLCLCFPFSSFFFFTFAVRLFYLYSDDR